MPFSIEDPKDVWDRIERVKRSFLQRDLMLDGALTALKVDPVRLRSDKKGFDDNTANAYLQAQVKAAVIRVALPYSLKLPTLPSMSPSDDVALENTELLLVAFTKISERNRWAVNKRPGLEDRASFAILRGAICSYVYWQDFSEVDPRRSWEPCNVEYDARHVYFEADQYGTNFLFIGEQLTEKELAGYASEQGWEGTYNADGTTFIPYYSVWYRRGTEVWGTVVGGPSGSGYSKKEAQVLQRAAIKPMFKSIPVSYFPAGGQAPTVHGTDATYGQTHYGGPFHKDMIEPARAIQLLDETLMATGHAIATPAIQHETESGTAGSANLILGQQVESVLGQEKFTPILATRADAMPYLLQKRRDLVDIIERLGLPFPLSQGMPRAALLESQLREQAERVLQPYLTPFTAAAQWIAEQQRAQLLYLLDTEGGLEVERKGEKIRAITAEVLVLDKKMHRREPQTREFKKDDLKWDGQIEAVILPPSFEVMATRNGQLALLLMKTGKFAIRPLKENLLGMEQPELDAREAEDERNRDLDAPVRHLKYLEERWGRLDALRRKLTARAALSARDEKFLADVFQENGQEPPAKPSPRLMLNWMGHYEKLIQRQEQLLNPPQPGQQGQVPQESADVNPAAAPSQGSPSGNGFEGGGGLEDDLSREIRALSGSDQNPGGA